MASRRTLQKRASVCHSLYSCTFIAPQFLVLLQLIDHIKRFNKPINEATPAAIKTSDNALLALLKRIKAANDPTEIKQLSEQIERVIFYKQFETV